MVELTLHVFKGKFFFKKLNFSEKRLSMSLKCNLFIIFTLSSLIIIIDSKTLECFFERHAVGEWPYWRHVCHKPREWMDRTQAENCIKLIRNGMVERGCDKEFYCNVSTI